MSTVRLTRHAECLVCDWAPDPAARAGIDTQAQRHTEQAGHATTSGASPEVRNG